MNISKKKESCKLCKIDEQIKKTEWVNCPKIGGIIHIYRLTCEKAKEIKRRRGEE